MSLSVAPVELPSWLSDVQLLAIEVGIGEHELRDLLRRLIRERLSATSGDWDSGVSASRCECGALSPEMDRPE